MIHYISRTITSLVAFLITFAVFSQADSLNRGIVYPNRPASLGILGDTADITANTQAGTVLMGGGKDVDAAFEWMIDKSGGGNVVIIRSSGTNAYNPYVFKLGKVSSVETLKIDSRDLANNDSVVRIIRNAEMLFIAGGDQSNYMKFWKGTKTADAINFLLNEKKVPVGGTSAGCAILSGIYYSGEGGSAASKDVLVDPYNPLVTLYRNDFLSAHYLNNIISDQHYLTRTRQGRHITFISRIIKDWNTFPNGIAADERTAVCVNGKGSAVVFGSSQAFFIRSSSVKPPEVCQPGKPLQWSAGGKALKVYVIRGTNEGAGSFNVKNFKARKARGGAWQYWWVDNGELKQADVR